MSYIRTKDGIYEVKKVEILCGVKFYDYETREDFVNRTREEHIINQADTIEELCDCFVTVRNRHIVWDKQHHNNDLTFEQVKFSVGKDFKIYGAIWTDKGLIYVAKMNKEGELELI